MSATAASATRFDAAFRERAEEDLPGLIPYVVAGFPERDGTAEQLLAAQAAGVLAAEVGIPFSDPLADGPTIQRAGWRALQNGMSLHLAVQQVADARARGVTMPLAAMTYVNPVLAYGLEAFARDANDTGLDGLIVPDLPDGESEEIRGVLHEHGVALIPLVAPTTAAQRVRLIAEHAAAFVYCVSVTGVTGARDTVPEEALQLLDRVRTATSLPRALGFGLSTHGHLQALRGHAEAAVVGSALIEAIGSATDGAAAAVERFCQAMLGRG